MNTETEVQITREGTASSNGRYTYNVSIGGKYIGTYESPRSARDAADAEIARRDTFIQGEA